MNEENYNPFFTLPDPNTFRWFVDEMFIQNQNERDTWKETPLSKEEYFKKNKWYLKKLFKEKNNGNA